MYAVIDIETTGGSPKSEKITEIAIYIYDGNKVVNEFSTLVNPEKSIPPYITGLTGITNEMVANAPKFYEIARKVVELTEGCTFVAHNASFDYGFMQAEFKSLGYEFVRERLCTVKLSRKLIPGKKSYSLGNICKDIGINIHDRHRAAGDALATARLFDYLMKLEKSDKLFDDMAEISSKGLHPNFDKAILKSIPSHTGIYYFHNQDGNIIYVGKSRDIRKRVISHLSNSTTRRAIEMRENIVDISYEITGSELVSLLLESDEIKKHLPRYNRSQRWSFYTYGLYSYYNEGGYLCFKIENNASGAKVPITSFRQLKEAKEVLFSLVKSYELCQKLCGLYDSAGECFYYALKECKGACNGHEPAEKYNLRAKKIIDKYSFSEKSFILIDIGRDSEESTFVWVENGKYLGFGFLPNNEQFSIPEQFIPFLRSCQDNRDTQYIINSFLMKGKILRKIDL